MPDTSIPFQIVIFTLDHTISGGIFLHDQRLSDHLNDRRDKNIILRNATVARLENPIKILEKTLFSAVPKSGIILAFEPPQKITQPPRRFIKYPKERHDVYVTLDGMEVRGELHTQGSSLDFVRILADAGDSFLPITNATVSILANPGLVLKRDTVLINTQRVRFIGDLGVRSPTEPVA